MVVARGRRGGLLGAAELKRGLRALRPDGRGREALQDRTGIWNQLLFLLPLFNDTKC